MDGVAARLSLGDELMEQIAFAGASRPRQKQKSITVMQEEVSRGGLLSREPRGKHRLRMKRRARTLAARHQGKQIALHLRDGRAGEMLAAVEQIGLSFDGLAQLVEVHAAAAEDERLLQKLVNRHHALALKDVIGRFGNDPGGIEAE